MADYPTDVHGPASQAPTVTYRYAVCGICGVQWQVKSEDDLDAQGCSFCGAPTKCVHIHSEQPGFEGSIIR